MQTQTKKTTKTAAIRENVYLNPGNRFMEYLSVSGDLIRLPHVIRSFDTSWEELPKVSDKTSVITFKGCTYAVGVGAKSQPGFKTAFEHGKFNLLIATVFAALEPVDGQTSFRVENLHIAVPDVRIQETKDACKKLCGTHEFTRNGQDLIVTIANVKLVEEATAAYNYGVHNGLYQWTDAVNGVIDFGGGTSSGRLYSEDGTNLRDASITLPGTDALARTIQARLLKDTGYSADLGQIMDGIENGSFRIGRNGESFDHVFPTICESWLNNIRTQAINKWSAYRSDLGEILMVGGSASLAKSLEEKTQGRLKMVANPQDVTILGMSL